MTPIYLTDRTAAETDDKCGMMFWWNRKEGKRGIVPKKPAEYLLHGRDIHEDLAGVAEMEDISPENIHLHISAITDLLTADDRIHQEKMEVLYRRLGWTAAWAIFMEPEIRREYENVSTESEIIYARDPLWCCVTPDRVLKHRRDGYLVYKEFKTAKWVNYGWTLHWMYDIQLHLGLAALEEELETPIGYGQVTGLLKGEVRNGRLSHPYVWGYRNIQSGEWTHEYQRGADWEPAPVWEYPGGVVEWVMNRGEEVARSQFPHSAPVFLKRHMVDDWVARRIHREEQIRAVQDICRESWEERIKYFEPRTQHCRPVVGDPCPYLAACWNATVRENPLRSGIFEERVPHHEIELTYDPGDPYE